MVISKKIRGQIIQGSYQSKMWTLDSVLSIWRFLSKEWQNLTYFETIILETLQRRWLEVARVHYKTVTVVWLEMRVIWVEMMKNSRILESILKVERNRSIYWLICMKGREEIWLQGFCSEYLCERIYKDLRRPFRF